MPAGTGGRGRPSRRGFEVVGPKRRAYTERGLAEVFDRARAVISRRLSPVRREWFSARRELMELEERTSRRRASGAVSKRRAELQAEMLRAEKQFIGGFLYFASSFPGILQVTSGRLSRLQALLVLQEQPTIQRLVNVFTNISRSRTFRSDWLRLKRFLAKNTQFQDNLNLFSAKKTALQRVITEGQRISLNVPSRIKPGGEVPKRTAQNYVSSLVNILLAQKSLLSQQKQLLSVMVRSSRQAGLREEFIEKLEGFRQQAGEIGTRVLFETEFWRIQLKRLS